MAGELDRLADAIDRLRRLNAEIREAGDPEEKRALAERQRSVRAEVVAAFSALHAAAAAGDEDAKELLRGLEG